MMLLPTEPIGSLPRPAAVIAGIQGFDAGRIAQAARQARYHAAVHETIQHVEATGSPVMTDGEQAKHRGATSALYGLENLAPDGVPMWFADGHMRHVPRLTAGPFREKTPADMDLAIAQRYAHVPLTPAVISASA
jgi:5-methyltetrahydropteroyltriglutamate--homocysteine methyltransferase